MLKVEKEYQASIYCHSAGKDTYQTSEGDYTHW